VGREGKYEERGGKCKIQKKWKQEGGVRKWEEEEEDSYSVFTYMCKTRTKCSSSAQQQCVQSKSIGRTHSPATTPPAELSFVAISAALALLQAS
jgi:hypothetical protein